MLRVFEIQPLNPLDFNERIYDVTNLELLTPRFTIAPPSPSAVDYTPAETQLFRMGW
mgnify:CR=1 FL=1